MDVGTFGKVRPNPVVKRKFISRNFSNKRYKDTPFSYQPPDMRLGTFSKMATNWKPQPTGRRVNFSSISNYKPPVEIRKDYAGSTERSIPGKVIKVVYKDEASELIHFTPEFLNYVEDTRSVFRRQGSTTQQLDLMYPIPDDVSKYEPKDYIILVNKTPQQRYTDLYVMLHKKKGEQVAVEEEKELEVKEELPSLEPQRELEVKEESPSLESQREQEEREAILRENEPLLEAEKILEAKYDLPYNFEPWEHLLSEDEMQTFQNAVRYAKPQGERPSSYRETLKKYSADMDSIQRYPTEFVKYIVANYPPPHETDYERRLRRLYNHVTDDDIRPYEEDENKGISRESFYEKILESWHRISEEERLKGYRVLKVTDIATYEPQPSILSPPKAAKVEGRTPNKVTLNPIRPRTPNQVVQVPIRQSTRGPQPIDRLTTNKLGFGKGFKNFELY